MECEGWTGRRQGYLSREGGVVLGGCGRESLAQVCKLSEGDAYGRVTLYYTIISSYGAPLLVAAASQP
jgi:hypothetical protein